MLSLKQGLVTSVTESQQRIQRINVEVGGSERPAVVYPGLTGAVSTGDRVVVNGEALDLGLGSGGFDLVLVNLSALPTGWAGEGHVMKLNYTPLQHSVILVEEDLPDVEATVTSKLALLALHSQLSAAAFALKQGGVERVAYLQVAGGALPGQLSDTAATLLSNGFLEAHITVAPCFGGQYEAGTLFGAIAAATAKLDCGVALVGPGPGIQGSASKFGHGGMQVLESAHVALSLGVTPLIVPRISTADRRQRHQGLSHHTKTVLQMLLLPVEVALASESLGAELAADLEPFKRHSLKQADTDQLVEGFRDSKLPARCMGRGLDQDLDFFRQPLAAGVILASKNG